MNVGCEGARPFAGELKRAPERICLRGEPSDLNGESMEDVLNAERGSDGGHAGRGSFEVLFNSDAVIASCSLSAVGMTSSLFSPCWLGGVASRT